MCRLAVTFTTHRSGSAPAAAWVKKTYWAIVEADPALPEAGTIEQPLARDTSGLPAALQPALTHFAVRARMGPLAWLELNPVTGTTVACCPMIARLTSIHCKSC